MQRKFIIIGMDDNRTPFFPPEVLEHIRQGKVFSGGIRHKEIVGGLLPDDAIWISITVPLDNVFAQYERVFAQNEKVLMRNERVLVQDESVFTRDERVLVQNESVSTRDEKVFIPKIRIYGKELLMQDNVQGKDVMMSLHAGTSFSF